MSSEMNTVSVIIPTWNRSPLLLRAVKSVLTQSYSPQEILVCDDGSTDDSKNKIMKLNNERIKWIAGDHTGLPAAVRNWGLKVARGEWIAFLDSDDEWLPDKLEKQLRVLTKSKLQACSTNAFRYENNIKIEKIINSKSKLISYSDLIINNQIISSSVIIHRSLIDNVGYFPTEDKLKAIEDYAYWLRIAARSDFAFICEPLVKYHNDPSSSIRYISERDPIKQKIYVLQSFIDWSNRNNIPEQYIDSALKELNKIRNMTIKIDIRSALSRIFSIN